MDTRDEARWIALSAAVRALAMHTARTANPDRPAAWLSSVMEAASELVAGIENPRLAKADLEQVQDAAQDALRQIFDGAVFPVRRG